MKFDYDINNYELKELENIFDFPEGYTEDIISSNEVKLRNSVTSDKTIEYSIKMQTLSFLTDAKNILLANSKNPTLAVSTISKKQPITSVPKYIVTHPDEYFPLPQNPVKKKTRTISLSIDTKFRPDYYVTQATNFTLTLPMTLHSVVSMQLGAMEMPRTAYFAVTEALGNNFIWLSVPEQIAPDLSGNLTTCKAYSTRLTLPDGNFTGDECITIFNKYLSNIDRKSVV